MPDCELCGKENNLNIAIVEGVKFNVCSSCSKFGKTSNFNNFDNKKEIKPIRKKIEIEESIVNNYFEIIRKNREKLGLSQKEFAIKINEKENLIAKIENGDIKPSFELANKLGKFFKINLIIKEEASQLAAKNKNITGLTIGDFFKNK